MTSRVESSPTLKGEIGSLLVKSCDKWNLVTYNQGGFGDGSLGKYVGYWCKGSCYLVYILSPGHLRLCYKITWKTYELYTNLHVYGETMLTGVISHHYTVCLKVRSSLHEMIYRIHMSSDIVDPNTFMCDIYKRVYNLTEFYTESVK